MGLKSIFREGMKERRRKKSLRSEKNEFKNKEKNYAEQLTALGKKAWVAKTDISAFGDLKTTLADAQKKMEDLRSQAEKVQQQKQESETIKKRENDRLNAGQKQLEEKKREVDLRLNEQKSTLLAGQKETQRATGRLAAIAGERVQLQNKNANPATAETEKPEIMKGLDLLASEEEILKTGISAREDAGKPLATLIGALQEESDQLQKQCAGLRGEQKKMLAEMEQKISALNKELAGARSQITEIQKTQDLNFNRLGEKLAAAHVADPNLAREIAAAHAARAEMEKVQALIGGLQGQKDEAQVSAYKKMTAIIIAGIILLAALIVLLFILLAPRKKESAQPGLTTVTPAESAAPVITTVTPIVSSPNQ